MAQEGWICPRCGKVNAPWVMQCSCNRNSQIIPKVGTPYYEGDQVTCNIKEINDEYKNAKEYINNSIQILNSMNWLISAQRTEALMYLNKALKELED